MPRSLARPLLCAALSTLVPVSAPLDAQRPTDAQVVSRIDEYMGRLEAQGYNGGVLVLRSGKPLLTRSYGFADRRAAIKADTSTVYNLGSITKQFTAAAILRLEEQGRLHTTDSIGRFFPNAPADKRCITLHQLLTHTAGFRSDYSPTDYEATTRDEYVRRMFDAPLRSVPGTTFFYANSGYSLLAAIVEIVTTHDYEIALRDLVLAPAGMLETGYKLPKWAPRRVAHGYQNGNDWGTILQRINMPAAPYWELRGNGGLHTTLGDIARWDAALTTSRVFVDSTRAKFMRGYVNEGPAGRSQYAYGWSVSTTSTGRRLIAHNGGNGIFVAELLRFVDDSITVFATSTVSDLTATTAVGVVARIALGQPYALPPLRVAIAADVMAAVQGRYVLQDGSHITLRNVGGTLVADAVGQQAFQLITSGDTASAANAAQLNAKSRLIVEGLMRGDIRGLRTALGADGRDSADIAKQESELLAYRRETFGDFQSIDVLGTVPGPEGGLRTTVRVNFTRGSATNLYTWDGTGIIMDIGARPYAPTELTMGDNGELRVLNPRAGGGVWLRVAAGTMTAVTATGTVTIPMAK